MDEEIKKVLALLNEAIKDGCFGSADQHRKTLEALFRDKEAAVSAKGAAQQTTSTMPKLPAQEDVLAYAECITHSDYWPLVRTKVASVYLYIKGQLSA